MRLRLGSAATARLATVAIDGARTLIVAVDGQPSEPFEPLTPGGIHVPNTNSYRWSEDRDLLWAADAIEEAILFEGPDTVAAVMLEPVEGRSGDR